MASYSVAEAKDKLPSLLNAVERGEAVTITRRGKPVANLMAVPPAADQLAETESSRGSTAWFLTEWAKLPPLEGDLQKILRAMRDGKEGW